MKDTRRHATRGRAPGLLALLPLIIAAMAQAQEAANEEVRRLTFEQYTKTTQTNRPKFEQAYKLLQNGKPAEAVPIVKEIIALDRQVLKEAASNPVEVERPQAADALERRGLGFGPPGLGGFSPGVEGLLRHPPRAPTLREFLRESLRSLELLEQLHETLGDYKAARGVAEETVGIITALVGEGSWQVRQAREEVRRLDRLASLDRVRLRALESARKATALVATAQGALGTAFCINPEGLYLTLDEVANPPSAQITTHFEYERGSDVSGTLEERSPKALPMGLILNLGGPDVKQLPVRVLWRDKPRRLVLLKVDSADPLPALELAGRGTVALGQEAMALGLPFVGRIAGLAASPTPTVRVRPGRIVSIRERRGEPWFYQLDSTPPPGSAGGPVIDERGRVIGLVVEGLPGTDIHYVLPVDARTPGLGEFALDFEPPALLYRDRHAPVDWAVRVYSKKPIPEGVAVEFRLGTGVTARVFRARRASDRVYTAQVVPVAIGETGPVELIRERKPGAVPRVGLLDTIVDSSRGSRTTYYLPQPTRETVADRDVRIGTVTIRLSELRRVELGPSPRALTVDGRRLAGPMTGLDGPQTGPRAVPELQPASVISIECPAPGAEPIEAEVIVKEGQNVLSRARKTLGYADPPFETTRRIDPDRVGTVDPPRTFGAPDIPMAAALVWRDPKKEDTGSRERPLPPRVLRLLETDVPPPSAPRPAQPALPQPRRGSIVSLAVGGAGRFVLLQLRGRRRLGVFDAQRTDFSGFVELADDEVLITANAEKGFVAYPKLRLIDRIDLESARIDRLAAFPFGATPRVLLAGSASSGPLLSIFHQGRPDDSFAQPVLGFLDPETMGLIAPRMCRRKNNRDWGEVPGPVLSVSGFENGRQADYSMAPSGDLACWGMRSPSVVFALNGDVADVFETPNHDGGFRPAISRRSFVTKSGRFDLNGSKLANLPDPTSIFDVIPSQDPAYYLVVRSKGHPASPITMPPHLLEVFSSASDRRLFAVDGLDEMNGPTNTELDRGQRYHLIPSARLLVTIPAENDRLVVRRLDILGELRRLGSDEVVITSSPIVGAVAGGTFRHRVEAYAKGDATFTRADGPEGLSVSPEGELRWDVPRAAAGREEVATVAVRSASGQEVRHKVYILVRGRG